MSNNSTSGEYKSIEESQEDIERRYKEAGYDFVVNYLETSFKDQINNKYRNMIENNNSSTDGTSDTSDNSKSEYVLVGNMGSLHFVQVLPQIVNGPKITLKTDKTRNKKSKLKKNLKEGQIKDSKSPNKDNKSER